jgi:hypothetical protein
MTPFPLRLKTPLAAATLTAALAGAEPALAADTLPVGSLDARATGGVSSAETAAPGSIVTGLDLETASGVLDHAALKASAGEEDGSEPLLRDANRGTVSLGLALTERLELSLGLHGTFEHVRPEGRDALFAEGGESEAGAGDERWHGVKQSGFAGASLLLKLKLLDAQSVKLALAPFIESGAGEQATYSLTRSVNPKAGFMALATYGAKGVAEASLNAGYRYRQPEAIGGVVLRNELFYKALVRAYASQAISFFVNGEGRRLNVADAHERGDDGKLEYAAQTAGAVGGGVTVALGTTELEAFGAARLRSAEGFGFGQRSFGFAIAVPIGHGRRSGASVAAAMDKKLDAEAAAQAAADEQATAEAQAKAQPAADEYPEMIGAEIDPFAAEGPAEGHDDFADAAKIERENAARTELSADEKIANELADIKAAEAKAEEERAKLEAAELEARRRSATKQAKEEQELMNEWMEDAKRDVDQIEGIGPDDEAWQGLE